ncbi:MULTISPECIES: LytTR family DNA-binding domain-containing protein [unclassified Arcicella]|uniref:LytR/AlgR family response regulator transcription factor n=1 Tax=unclassified Arcicella TaxID=2644986 RepID=UPI00286BDA7C|nr:MULTISPECIES: LytTR family DNA-binding domain-containing protein [unclassified Arcicella]
MKVFVSDIIFIEGLDNYLKIHLLNQKPLIVRMTMKACLENLSNNQFVRVHRSFIVAIKHIQFVRNKMIFISKETTIPLGNSYEEGFFNIYGK